ncbi:YceI family protein [Solitalea sp. MAHUQ-68]|uniref:YceI family protein n=1 Tax=Solitalea agri TaxID=2953739 RepID=A0A9X2JEW1_9SPHI|nr:YceI family protein [Solitalea agri]MCO4292811.1 YceI family protein [Solitalea agri]
MHKFTLITLIAFLLTSLNSYAQQPALKLSAKESKVLIHGTSSVHDWTAQCDNKSGDLIALTDKSSFKTIQSLSLKISSKSIRSIDEKGAYYDDVMDGRIWSSLEADKYSEITISLKQVKAINIIGPKAVIDAIAIVTIHGVRKELPVKVTAETANNSIRIKGTKEIKMLDFAVQPPTILLEFLKTGNEITIEFDLLYK